MCWTSKMLLSVLLELLCIQLIVVRCVPLPNPGLSTESNDDLDSGIGNNLDDLDFVTDAFSNLLRTQLEGNEAFMNLFSKPMNTDSIYNLASSVAQSFVSQLGIADSYSAANVISKALSSVAPGDGPQAYSDALTNAVCNILLNNKIINSQNFFDLPNTINKILLDFTSNILESGNSLKLGGRSGVNIDGNVLGNGLNNAYQGLGTNQGLDINNGPIPNAGIRPFQGTDIGLGVNLGLDANAGINSLNGTDVGLDINTGLNVNVGENAFQGANTNNLGFPLGNGAKSVLGTELTIDLSVSNEANLQFKYQLTKELLKDGIFRNTFTAYISPDVLRQISSAICQYISKAFGISRLILLPLENSISNLQIESSLSPELYAEILTNSLTDLLSKLNLITNATARLQAVIAANAITSGIVNYLRLSTTPGMGFSINDNAFNSYFSVLNGLEKLPYVGIEAASSKLSPSVKSMQGSINASIFAKRLFYSIMSSRKFLDMFSLCAPIYVSKNTANTLGIFMAEAFGSPNLAIFSDLYSKAMLTIGSKLNTVNYARAISSATAKALYLGGYFSSGNINIQAAIAFNAILRALTTKVTPVTTQLALFPTISKLSWITQLNGVSPSEILLKYGIDTNVAVAAGLGLISSLNPTINTGLGVGADIRTGVNAGLITQGIMNNGLGVGLGLNAGLQAGLGTNLGLGAELGLNTGLQAGLGTNLGLGAGLGINSALGDGLGLKAGLGAGLGLNDDLRANLGLNAGLGIGGTGLSLNSGLGIGLNTGLGTNLDVDSGLTAGITSSTGSGLGSNAGLGINTGLGAGIGVNAGLGPALNADVGLGVGFNDDLGLSNVLSTRQVLNSDLGTTDLDVGIMGLGQNSGKNRFSRKRRAVDNLVSDFGLENGNFLNLDLDLLTQSKSSTNTGKSDSKTKSQRNLGMRNEDGFKLNAGADLGTDIGLGLNAAAGLGLGKGFDTGTGINPGLGAGVNLGLKAGADAGLGLDFGAGLGAGVNLGLKSNANSDLGVNLGSTLGIGKSLNSRTDLDFANGLNLNSNVLPQTSVQVVQPDNQLSILKALPLILANKLYQSTALYTSVSMVGPRTTINLISQALATAFGSPIAAVFLRSYNQYVRNYADNNSFEVNVVGLAQATTEALAGIGLLSSKFSVSTANQLAAAVVSKFSSLIATSLEANNWSLKPQWTYLLNQDLIQVPLIPGYNIFK